MAANTIRNVILVGASGEVGKNILPDLLADPSFNVSVLSRQGSSATFPDNVTCIRAEYSDKGALVKAFTGQDVVVSTVGGEALIHNLDRALIEAALAAGVKWFLPSEYGFDLDDRTAAAAPCNIPSVQNVELLRQNQSHMAYTCISTGAFLDWCLDTTFLGFDIPNCTAKIFDDGKRPASGTLITSLGKAVSAILHHPEQTMNRRIYLAHTTFTQQDVLDLLERFTGARWSVTHATTEESFRQADEQWQGGSRLYAMYGYITGLLYSGTGACFFGDRAQNHALGLETRSLEQIVREAVQRAQTPAQ